MTDHQTTDAAQPVTAGFCSSCGARVAAESTFCGSCGQPLGAPGAGEPARTQLGAAPPEPPFSGSPPGDSTGPNGYPPMPYPGQPQPRQANTGLIVGLVAAGFLAVGVIAAVILLATGSRSASAPTISTTTSAAAAITPSPGTAPATHTSAGSAGSLVTPAPKRKQTTPAVAASPTTTTTTAPVAPAPTAGPADIEAARQVVMHHWSFINSGNFSAAFALFVPGSQGSESSWVSAHQQEAPISASVSTGTPTFSDSTDANVPLLSLQTTDPTDGCSAWTGSYDVQKADGQWLISKANLQKQSC